MGDTVTDVAHPAHPAQTLCDLLPHAPGCIPETYITIGNFDGVHIGHQALLTHARRSADKVGLPLVAVTFDPHPLELLAPNMAPARLTDMPTRLRLMRTAGVQLTLVLPFTPELAAMPPDVFVRDTLIAKLGLRKLLVGYDFSLGKGRSGTATVLAGLAQTLGIGFERFGPFLADGEPVSSTRIRQLLRAGELSAAARLLGRSHSVRGTVVPGFQRGRLLGFPTANLTPPTILLPPIGVYATWARLGVERFPAVTNVGHNPTFGGDTLTVETHLLDMSRDLYGQELEVEFVQQVRGQIRFDGPQALTRQIEHDVREARIMLAVARGA